MAGAMGLLVLLVAAAVLPAVSAAGCPSFASAKSSCTTATCGHFVYKGSFIDNGALLREAQLEAATAAPAECCNQCRQAETCAYWNFFAKTGRCQLFKAELCQAEKQESDKAGPGQGPYDAEQADSYVGGYCQAPAVKETIGVASDEARALPEKTFCLVSDKNLHINMLLNGYLDPRTGGASTVKGGLAVRTWIRELGFLWTYGGKSHTLRLVSRRGAQQERGEGYLSAIEVDGTTLPRLSLGDELNLFDGQATLSFEAYEKTGPYDIDLFKLKIADMLEAEVRLRIAHPLLQLEGDAEVHMNMDILDMSYTPGVHGVLGQSYRDDRLDQALNYAALSDLMSFAGAGNGRKTIETLDGTADAYLAKSALDPDCSFSQYTPRPMGLSTPLHTSQAFPSAAEDAAKDAGLFKVAKEGVETAAISA